MVVQPPTNVKCRFSIKEPLRGFRRCDTKAPVVRATLSPVGYPGSLIVLLMALGVPLLMLVLMLRKRSRATKKKASSATRQHGEVSGEQGGLPSAPARGSAVQEPADKTSCPAPMITAPKQEYRPSPGAAKCALAAQVEQPGRISEGGRAIGEGAPSEEPDGRKRNPEPEAVSVPEQELQDFHLGAAEQEGQPSPREVKCSLIAQFESIASSSPETSPRESGASSRGSSGSPRKSPAAVTSGTTEGKAGPQKWKKQPGSSYTKTAAGRAADFEAMGRPAETGQPKKTWKKQGGGFKKVTVISGEPAPKRSLSDLP